MLDLFKSKDKKSKEGTKIYPRYVEDLLDVRMVAYLILHVATNL